MNSIRPALKLPCYRGRFRAGLFLFTLLLACPAAPAAAENSEPAVLASRSLLLDAAFAGSSLIAVGERGHVLLSADNGTSWQQIITPTRALLTAVTFTDEQHGWAVGQDAIILATTDGGKTWQQQFHTSQLPDNDTARDSPLLDISCVNSTFCSASGAYGLLLQTKDGGASWQRIYAKEDDRNFYTIHMLSLGHIIIAGESGV